MSYKNDTVITWDLKNNKEIQQSEVGKNYEITWDKEGNPLIVNPENVIYNGNHILAFDIDDDTLIRPKNSLRSYRGHRFDGKNQNWFIIK